MATPWHRDMPHNELPPPPPVEDLESRAVLKDAVAARVALARLDVAAASIPNPTVLINAIPLLEAQASSEIENIVTTTDALFRHAQDDAHADPPTKEALRYRTALRAGFEQVQSRGLTTSVAVQVCSTIKGHVMDLRSLPGTRIGNPLTGEIAYSPPEGRDLIARKLSEWESFVHADDGMDPLVRMAAAHHQFEAIHPFTDGNGRTGRILNILMLTDVGLLQQPLLYLSRYFIETKAEYYRLLLSVTAEGAWEDWIRYVLTGVAESSTSTLEKIGEIRTLQERFAHAARAVSRGSADSELQSALFEQPYCRITTVMERCDVSRPTATKWLESLLGAGLVSDVRVGRERLFINHELLEILALPQSAVSRP
ncbi:MAG: Fic family protein [Actinomycetales bacterium]|nr:Fic family protein [Actinomycetales bacterium]